MNLTDLPFSNCCTLFIVYKQMEYLKIAAFLLLIISTTSLTVADFKPALFHTSQPSGFYTIQTGSPNSGQILAFGDLNGDKYTDYLSTNDRLSPTIQIYYWSDSSSSFTSDQFTLSRSTFTHLQQIMIGDVDADGINQLVVTYLMDDKTYASQIYDVSCEGKCRFQMQKISFAVMEKMIAVPVIIDIVGDGHVGILTFIEGGRNVVSYLNANTLTSTPWNSFINSHIPSFNPVLMHFTTQIDLNGDCNSDLIILSISQTGTTVFQFYLKQSNNKYKAPSLVNSNKIITWINFADIDANGAVDMLLVAVQGNNFVSYVVYNSNTPKQICKLFDVPSFDLTKIGKIALPNNFKLTADSRPKFGDFNFDGYPDLLAIFSSNQFRTVSILNNRQGQQFTPFLSANINQLQQIGNPVQAALYDYTQNGKLDLIIISQVTRQDNSIALVRTSIVNNIIEDTLFIKILPLLPSSSQDFSSTAISSAMGVTIQWIITNLDGDKTISVLNQKCQWNYGSLQLPFVTSGLGRTNNYIEELTVGYPGYGQKQTWTPIIPNSQLILQRRSDSDWILQTLLKDNSRVYDVIYISIICLFLMGVMILFLNWRENMQDKRDHYNFIQMIR